MRILGIDPGLQRTGWGIIDQENNALRYIASGTIRTDGSEPLSQRLAAIDEGLGSCITQWCPDTAAVEETFVNRNPASALKLGLARGVAMVTPARAGLDVAEYAANLVKKTVVGTGHAGKDQVAMMVRTLLPASGRTYADEADALAIAICHAHQRHVRLSTLITGQRA